MRIKAVQIKKLFGEFDYYIPLHLDEHITILHGPNGCGKTAVLKIIQSVFDDGNATALDIPFEIFTAYFDENVILQVKQSSKDLLIYDYIINVDIFNNKENNEEETGILLNNPENSQHFERYWHDEFPDWFAIICRRIQFKRIETQRLIKNEVIESYKHAVQEDRRYLWKTMEFIKRFKKNELKLKELSSRVGLAISKVSEEDTETFVQSVETLKDLNLIVGGLLKDPQIEKVIKWSRREQYYHNEAERSMYAEISSLRDRVVNCIKDYVNVKNKRREKFDGDHHLSLNDIIKLRGTVLLLEEVMVKTKLMQSILNQRLWRKKMQIQEGKVTFQKEDGSVLEPYRMSSGEQHQFLLMFDLLFQIPQGTTVLLDEPEISLHIAWQQFFLDDLRKIIELCHRRAIIDP